MNQNFCTVLLKKSCLNLHRLFHNSGTCLGTHYDTLKLKNNCTAKEIRDSFIKLSKENHPDVNKSPKAHKEFLKIQEAYNVLSKAGSRANYDLGLVNPSYGTHRNTTNVGGRYQHTYGGQRVRNPWDDPFFYHNRPKSDFYEEQPYYGIKGINKVSNGTVASYIIVIAFISFIGQLLLIKYSFGIQRQKMLKKSQETQESYHEIRERANRNGNELQVEILRKQFEEARKLRMKMKQSQDAAD